MNGDAGNTQEHWDAYWSRSKSRVETYSMREAVYWINHKQPKSILDVGCGDGRLLAQIKYPCRKLGIDLSLAAINRMWKRYQIEGRQLLANDIDKLGEKFDFIVCNHTLEHLQEDADFLKKCGQVVNPGGTVFIAVPNDMSTPDETDEHVWVYDHRTLRELMERCLGSCWIKIIGNHLLGVSQM